MPLNNYSQSEPQKPNYWFYLTMILLLSMAIGVIAYFAYQLGQNNVAKQMYQPNEVKVSSNSTAYTNQKAPLIASSANTPPTTNVIPQPEKQPLMVNGQMFIVTKGRDNIKLALVKVCAVSEDFITNWIRTKQVNSVNLIKEAQQKVNAAKQELQKIDTQIQQTPDGEYGFSSAKSDLEYKRITLSSNVTLAEIRRDYYKSPEYYFEGLNQCEIVAKTDADGKFSMALPSGRKYAITAETSRKVFDSSETYWWMLWADSSNMVLSNDNLMHENPSNAVVRINR